MRTNGTPLVPPPPVSTRNDGDAPRQPPPSPAARGRVVHSRYDASITHKDNLPLWGMADFLSAKAANSHSVRRVLKIRSRYERDNNGYYAGMVDQIADDTVGSGPRLEMRTPDSALNAAAEKAWQVWAQAIGLGEKLQTMVKARVVDGEAFGLHVSNPGRVAAVDSPVQLDLSVIESDQVMTPAPGFTEQLWVDGLTLDKMGNVVEYHVLRNHPGDLFVPQLNPMAFDRWSPRAVRHWFRPNRPGQCRGIPETTPALELFAQLRRFTGSTLRAAETAADLSAVLHTDAPPDTGADVLEPWDVLEIERGMVTVPAGWKLNQMVATHPSTTYEMFEWVLLRQISRTLRMPLNVVAGDSSKFNFASGKLDHLPYRESLRNQRAILDSRHLDAIFRDFWREARLVRGLLGKLASPEIPDHRWFWAPFQSINNLQDSQAEALDLANNVDTLAEQCAERGKDWEEVIAQRGREYAALQKAGVPVLSPAPNPTKGPTESTTPDNLPQKKPAKKANAAALDLEIQAYSEDQPREPDGKFGEGGPGTAVKEQTKTPATKAEIAKANHKMVDKDIQRYAEERNEPMAAKELGGKSEPDNAAYDVAIPNKEAIEHGVELKTMVDNKNSKITMKASAMERKAAWEKENNATFHTVVMDDQKVFNANGPGQHGSAKDRVLYYRRGAGSFRVGAMHKCKDWNEVKDLMGKSEADLPAGAKPTDSWKATQAAAGAKAGKKG